MKIGKYPSHFTMTFIIHATTIYSALTSNELTLKYEKKINAAMKKTYLNKCDSNEKKKYEEKYSGWFHFQDMELTLRGRTRNSNTVRCTWSSC